MLCPTLPPLPRPDRRALPRPAQQRGDSALDDLLDYAGRVAALVAAQCAWRPSAVCEREDLVQVARLEAWRRYRAWDPSRGASLLTYAHSYVAGAVLDHLRAVSRPRRVARPDVVALDAMGPGAEPGSPAPDPERQAQQAEARRIVGWAMESLPRRQRAELLAYYRLAPRGRRSERHERALICLRTVLREHGYDLEALL